MYIYRDHFPPTCNRRLFPWDLVFVCAVSPNPIEITPAPGRCARLLKYLTQGRCALLTLHTASAAHFPSLAARFPTDTRIVCRNLTEHLKQVSKVALQQVAIVQDHPFGIASANCAGPSELADHTPPPAVFGTSAWLCSVENRTLMSTQPAITYLAQGHAMITARIIADHARDQCWCRRCARIHRGGGVSYLRPVDQITTTAAEHTSDPPSTRCKLIIHTNGLSNRSKSVGSWSERGLV